MGTTSECHRGRGLRGAEEGGLKDAVIKSAFCRDSGVLAHMGTRLAHEEDLPGARLAADLPAMLGTSTLFPHRLPSPPRARVWMGSRMPEPAPATVRLLRPGRDSAFPTKGPRASPGTAPAPVSLLPGRLSSRAASELAGARSEKVRADPHSLRLEGQGAGAQFPGACLCLGRRRGRRRRERASPAALCLAFCNYVPTPPA